MSREETTATSRGTPTRELKLPSTTHRSWASVAIVLQLDAERHHALGQRHLARGCRFGRRSRGQVHGDEAEGGGADLHAEGDGALVAEAAKADGARLARDARGRPRGPDEDQHADAAAEGGVNPTTSGLARGMGSKAADCNPEVEGSRPAYAHEDDWLVGRDIVLAVERTERGLQHGEGTLRALRGQAARAEL